MKFNSFLFNKSYYEAIDCLEDEMQQLHLYKAIFSYVFRKTTPQLTKAEQSIFILIKPNIDTSAKKYQAKVKNGKKGGAPKGNQNAKKSGNNLKQPKNNLKTSKNNIEKEKEKEKENEKEIEKDLKDTSFSKKQRKKSCKSIDEVLNKITNIDLKTNLQEFVKSRSSMKRPLTTYALELAIKHLKEIAKTESEQIEIIKRSITNGWLEFYPLTTERPKDEQFIHNNYTKEQIGKFMTTDLDNIEL